MAAALEDGLGPETNSICQSHFSAPLLKRKAHEAEMIKAECPTSDSRLLPPSGKRACADSDYESEVLDLTTYAVDAMKTDIDSGSSKDSNAVVSRCKSDQSNFSPHSSLFSAPLGTILPELNGFAPVSCPPAPWYPILPVLSPSLGYDPRQITAFNPTDLTMLVQKLGFGGTNATGPMSTFGANLFTAGLSLVPNVPSHALNLLPIPSLPVPADVVSSSESRPVSPTRSSASQQDSELNAVQEPLNLNISSSLSSGLNRLPWTTNSTQNGDHISPPYHFSFPSNSACSTKIEHSSPSDVTHQLTHSISRTETCEEEADEMMPFEQFRVSTINTPSSLEHRRRSATNSPMNGLGHGSFAFDGPNSDVRPPSTFDDSSDDPYTPKPIYNPIRKYTSHEECGSSRCQSSALREHYHCRNCNKVIIRREEMIRHAKWHRKREESLQYGFMRYSPADNCAIYNCVHNGRQTHYHCMKTNCSKVYISTSDVQMHANFHRKDAVIIQEGFQRFRASESCGIQNCPFYQERTTHFHCRRTNCRFTFKNKSDMEKHKMHHQKNDNFAKDGFRKYIKCESCDYPGCKYSGIINHIHCIRPGCDYVVHSSSQILSHKRKHDRRFSHFVSLSHDTGYTDFVRMCNDSVSDMSRRSDGPTRNITASDDYLSQPTELPLDLDLKGSDSTCTTERPNSEERISPVGSCSMVTKPITYEPKHNAVGNDLFYELSRLTTRCIQHRNRSSTATDFDSYSSSTVGDDPTLAFLFPADVPAGSLEEEGTHIVRIFGLVGHYFRCYSSPDECGHADCQNVDEQSVVHGHCYWPGCPVGSTFGQTGSTYCSQWTGHIWQAALFRSGFIRCDRVDCGREPLVGSHVHCYFWPACDFTAALTENQFASLSAHITQHDARLSSHYAEELGTNEVHPVESITASKTDAVNHVPKRRGRPPKYTKYIQVPRFSVPDELCADDVRVEELRRDMFTQSSLDTAERERGGIVCGVKQFPAGVACPDDLCEYSCRGLEHYHCIRPRCFMATDNLELMNVHRREFHNHITIANGFEHFDRSVDCRRPTCHSRKMSQHYHCTYPNCDYAFIRPTTMTQHARKHEELSRSRHNSRVCTGSLRKVRWMFEHNRSPTPSDPPPPQYPVDSFRQLKERKLPCLPLGMSPMAVAQLPALFSGPTDTSTYVVQETEVTAEDRLPGFLPIWAAAMAAAAAAAKSTADSSTMFLPGTSPSFYATTGYNSLEENRISHECVSKDVEETSVSV